MMEPGTDERTGYLAWAALGAVAAGTVLAVSGLRRSRLDPMDLDDYDVLEMDDEDWLLDVAVPCSPEPPL